MRPTVKVLSASVSSMRVFQKRMLSGSPSRSRGPGSSSRKKSASCASKDRNPFGTILIGWLVRGRRRGREETAWCRNGQGASFAVRRQANGFSSSGRCSARKCRKSSAMSFAVVYRSEARFDKRLQTDALQFLRDRVVPLPGRTNFPAGDLLQQFLSGVRLKRSPSGQQFVEDDAQAEDVTAAIHPMPFATGLFGTHVGGRPGVAWSLAHVLLPQGQPEIGHKRLAALVEQDVARLDVPMHQPLLVGVVQRLGHRRHQFDGFVHRQPGLLEPRGEVGAVDVLRDDEAGKLFGAADIMDRHDVRVIEIGDRAGFGQIGFGIFGAIHQLAMRHLDRDETLQLVVVGEVDEAETALAQHSLDPVATDLLWCCGGSLIPGCRLIRACPVEVVHGPFPKSGGSSVPGDYTRWALGSPLSRSPSPGSRPAPQNQFCCQSQQRSRYAVAAIFGKMSGSHVTWQIPGRRMDIAAEFLSAAINLEANKRLADRAVEQVPDDKLHVALHRRRTPSPSS